jgi:hypothetical protein
MHDGERRSIGALERAKQYSLDNPGDFGGGTVQKTNIDLITAELALIHIYAKDQASGIGEAGLALKIKRTNRENLVALLRAVGRTAKTMKFAFDGIHEQFWLPRNTTDQQLLALARAWFNSSQNYEADFIAYGLPADFRDSLNAAAESFDNSMGPVTTALDARIAATAQLRESIRRAMIALKILDTVMQNLYAENAGKRAAWDSASHIERPAKKKTPSTPTP